MLFLVVCVYDEGVYEDDFRVVEAPSRLAVAQHILTDAWEWKDFLDRARLYDPILRAAFRITSNPNP